MPRHALISQDRLLFVKSVAPHLFPWIRFQTLEFQTEARGKQFSVRILDQEERVMGIYPEFGRVCRVGPSLWKRFLQRYIAAEGTTALYIYRDLGPMGSYLLPVIEAFFKHLRTEECRCFDVKKADSQMTKPAHGSQI